MSLPTRIKVNIRDLITSTTSRLAERTSSLTAVLGYSVTLDPEWAMLWTTLEPHFPDNATFVPYVAIVVEAWCDAFTTWIEDENNEEDVDKILEGLKWRQTLQLMLVSDKGTRPRTNFEPTKKYFNIVFPQCSTIATSTILAGFADDLRSLFAKPPPIPITSKKSALADEPDWADVSESVDTQSVAVSVPHRAAATSSMPLDLLTPETFPDVKTVERPEEFLKRPPYWLLVRQEGRGKVVVEGSHGPTLGFLDSYLKKWCRGEIHRVDRPPMIQVNLKESPFGLGLLHDSLVLEALRGREVSALIILSLVETVLGYESVPNAGSAGSVWEFKRMRAFK